MSPLENMHERDLYYILSIMSEEINSNDIGSRSYLEDRIFTYKAKDHRSITSPKIPECRAIFKYLKKNKLIKIVSCKDSKEKDCVLSDASIINYSVPIRSAIHALKLDLEIKINEYSVAKENLSNKSRISLAFEDGVIYVCFEAREFKLNDRSPLRWDSTPYNFFNVLLPKYGVNQIERANTDLIKTSRSLLEMINKAGIKGLLRKYFFPVASSGYVKFKNPVYVPVINADKIYKNLEKAENNT